MSKFWYFIGGFISGLLIGLCVVFLRVTNSPDKNCFILEPDESAGGGYQSSGVQTGLGLVFAIVGSVMAVAVLVGSGVKQEE